MKKIILIDGNNLMFRSYYATAYSGSIMRNSKGLATNALYGFYTMINKIINEEKPEYMIIAFDVGKNFRHDKYKEYKAGRNETPDDLKKQMPLAKEMLDVLGIKYLESVGYEADDIIGTIANYVDNSEDYEGLIISSDHDLLQLISSKVKMKLLKSKDSIYYTKKSFEDEYGFEPKKVVDLKSLMGDSSDNIPGVKGIGEKTAKTLVQKYRSLNEIYNHIEEIKGKLKVKLELDKENAFFSYELATIYKEVPLKIELSDLKYVGPNIDKLQKMFQELEFHSFLKNISITNPNLEKVNFIEIENVEDIQEEIEYSYYIECDKENYHNADILCMSLYDGKNMYYIKKELVRNVISKLSGNLRYTFGLKKNIVLANKLDVELNNTDYDLLIAYYLLDGFTKDDIAIKMTDNGINCYFYDVLKKRKVENNELKTDICLKSKFIWETRNSIIERLSNEEMSSLYYDIEMPLIKVLSSMEISGIHTDKEILKEMQLELSQKIKKLTECIWELSGEKFNVSSPKQLADVLFNKLEIPYPNKKSKTISTDSSVLEKIVNYHPIVKLIIEYRRINKIYNTYVEPLEEYIQKDGKIHTIYKQTLTRTGRLSSVEPNLQNLPSHEEEGRLVKKAFLADSDSILLSADYSQIELRILAHISGDEEMIYAFNNGIDIHKKVASDIYGVPLDEVTKEMRSNAKQVIFGIVYGISGFGLSENIHMTPTEAKAFINKYYEFYPKVKEYMDQIKKDAYDKGYVKTLYNRKRIIEELTSPVYMIRTSGERIALNTPIQGTGADIIKMAMIKIFNELKKNNLKSQIILQVHDEIILNVKKEELEIVKDIVKSGMENVTNWEIKLLCEISTGKDWYDTK